MATKFVGISDEKQINQKDVIKVKLPATGTYAQGDQLVAEVLVAGTRGIYQGVAVTSATAETVTIINQGVYKDEFGNRHGLVANVGKITYEAGEIVTCLRQSKNVILEITTDAVSGTVAVGKFLIPQVEASGERRLVVADAIGTATTAYKIEALSTLGGAGNTRTATVIVRTVK